MAQRTDSYIDNNKRVLHPKPVDNSVEARSHYGTPNQNQNVSRGAVVWSETFGGGLSSPNGTWSTGSMPQPTLWAWNNTNPPIPNGYNTFYNSKTPGDGWMLFDCYTNWITNHSNPYDYTVSTYGELTSPVINLSASPDVRLNFVNEFYHCCNFEHELKVQVSTDGFFTHIDEYVFENTVSTPRNEFNIDVSDPNISLDISSSVAVNPSTVQLRFIWDGTAADANNQKAVIYWWMIDDIEIVELDSYDAKGGEIIVTSQGGDPMYTYLPLDEAFATDIEVEVHNYGALAINDLQVEAKVDGATSGNLFTGAIPANSSLAVASKDTFLVTTNYTPSTTEEVVSFSAIAFSDSTDVYDVSDNNDCDTVFVTLTDTVWGRDDNVFGGRQDPEHTGTLNREYAVGNMFEFHQAATVNSISFWLSVWSGADNGPLAKVVLWQFAGGNPSNWVEVHASSDFSIDTTIINGEWWTVKFDEPIQIAQGEEFAAMIYHYSQVDTVWTAISGTDDFAQGRLWTWDDDPAPGQFTMFSTGNAPLVRLNLAGPEASIEELPEMSAFSAAPNPFNDEIQLRFSLPESRQVDIDIVDVTGKIVYSQSLGNLPQGLNRHQIDTSHLNDGVYFVNARTEKGVKTSRVVKLK